MTLTVRDLHAGYGAVAVLHGVDFTVAPGEVLCLMGRNGAGKSTTLKAIMGLVRATSGEIRLDSTRLDTLPAHDVPRAGIAWVPQGRRLFAEMTVAENLEIGLLTRRSAPEVRERALALFPRLRERLGQASGTLSGGEQQMLAIARALLARPKLLLLDEPSLGLAPQIVKLIFQIVQQIAKDGTTILLVEQNAHMALGVADVGHVLEVGTLVTSGPAKQLAADDAIRKAYLGVH